MRECVDRLIDALEPRGTHFIEQQRQKDRHWEFEDQAAQADLQRIHNSVYGVRCDKNALEIAHTHPRAAENPQVGIILFEGKTKPAMGSYLKRHNKRSPGGASGTDTVLHRFAKTKDFFAHAYCITTFDANSILCRFKKIF